MAASIALSYSAGTPLTRTRQERGRISVNASRSWEPVALGNLTKDCPLSCAIPIIRVDADHDEDDDEGHHVLSSATAIYKVDDAGGDAEHLPLTDSKGHLASRTSFPFTSPAADATPDPERTHTSCPAIERLRSRLEDSEDDLAPSTESDDQIFRYNPPMEPEFLDDATFDAEADNELLRCVLDTRLPLIESLHPELAPHIVITPAITTVYDDWVAWTNRPQPQWEGSLNVPPTWIYPECMPNYTRATQPDLPLSAGKKVFKRRAFELQIEQASVERLVMYHVVTAIHRRALKAVAYAAAAVAHARQAAPEPFVDPLPPFKWQDPAVPLLADLQYVPNTLVLASDDAFLAPHIVISGAPTENPWVAWMNIPPEQYVGALTIPGMQTFDCELYDEEPLDISSQDDSECGDDSLSSEEEDSEVETPRAGSPLSLSEEVDMVAHLDRYLDAMFDDEIEMAKDDFESLHGAQPWDDEDELPVLDEWYLDIAQRTGVSVHLASA